MDKLKFYNRHLKENDMSYFQHLKFALFLSVKTSGCAIASLIHAFLPFILVDHTSKTINKLNAIFVERSRKKLSINNINNELNTIKLPI
jgi:rhamnose utilization protein RhaD (predicted bifunctional aldolase and dehydrogenase)